MKLICGNRLTEITMRTWTGNGYTPDWSQDFFSAGILPYNDAIEAYEVEDIDYCIDQAQDWKNGEGDYYGEDTTGRDVDVTELDLPPLTKDNEYINVGMWLSDQTGIYEVKDVTGDQIELTEIIFDGDGDKYHHGDRRILTKAEARKLEYN